MVLTICVAGAEWASAQKASPSPDDTKPAKELPSNQIKKQHGHKSDPVKTEQMVENKTRSAPSGIDCSQQKAVLPHNEAQPDPSASQNLVEYGGGG